MQRQLRWFLLLLVVIILSIGPASFSADTVINFNKGYAATAKAINEMAYELESTYPDWVEVETIGYSVDGKPIVALRLTENINQKTAFDYTQKRHVIIDAGVHARETINPVLVLKMVEDYIKDAQNDAHLGGYNSRTLLSETVLHVIPNVNPDGFDLVKFGAGSLVTPEVKTYFDRILPEYRQNRLKANANGVDLNRNFEDVYLIETSGAWVDQWQQSGLYRRTDEPDEDFFKGYSVASEPETQAMMDYLLSYDFRGYVSFHSMGQVIYYFTDHLGTSYLKMNESFAKRLADITNYMLMPPSDQPEFGYSTYYFSNNTYKPAITVETTPTIEFPTPLTDYNREYYGRSLWKIPLELMLQTKALGYYDYKVYNEGAYVRDYPSKVIADAFVKKFGGEVHYYKGDPSYRIAKEVLIKMPGPQYLMRSIKSSEGVVYVEFREIFEMFSYRLAWVPEAQKAVGISDANVVSVDIKNHELLKIQNHNVTRSKITPPPVLIEGRVMLPLDVAFDVLGISTEDLIIVESGKNIYLDL